MPMRPILTGVVAASTLAHELVERREVELGVELQHLAGHGVQALLVQDHRELVQVAAHQPR